MMTKLSQKVLPSRFSKTIQTMMTMLISKLIFLIWNKNNPEENNRERTIERILEFPNQRQESIINKTKWAKMWRNSLSQLK